MRSSLFSVFSGYSVVGAFAPRKLGASDSPPSFVFNNISGCTCIFRGRGDRVQNRRIEKPEPRTPDLGPRTLVLTPSSLLVTFWLHAACAKRSDWYEMSLNCRPIAENVRFFGGQFVNVLFVFIYIPASFIQINIFFSGRGSIFDFLYLGGVHEPSQKAKAGSFHARHWVLVPTPDSTPS